MNDDSHNQNHVIDGTQRAVLVGVELATPTGRLAAADGLARLGQRPHLICHATFLIDRLAFAAECSQDRGAGRQGAKAFGRGGAFRFRLPGAHGHANTRRLCPLAGA